MTVRISDLVAALRAQSVELSSAVLAGRRNAVAQQLLYQACADINSELLRPVAAARLEALVRSGRGPVVAARWTSSRPRRRLEVAPGEITALAVAPDGSSIVFATSDCVLRRRRITPEPTSSERVGHLGHIVSSIAIAADSRSFITGDHSGAVVAWVLEGDEVRVETLGRHGHYVRRVVTDRGTGAVYSSGDDGLVMCWRYGEGHEIARLGKACAALALDPATGGVYSGDQGGEIWCWDSTARQSGTLVGRHGTGPVTALAMLPGSVVVSTAWDGVLLAWDLADSATAEDPGGSSRHPRLIGQAEVPFTGGFAENDERLVTGTADGRVLSWQTGKAGQAPALLGLHDRGIAAVSAESGVVVTGARDGFIVRWDEAGPVSPGPYDIEVWAIAVRPDEAAVLTGGIDGIHLWTPLDGQVRPRPRRLSGESVNGITFTGQDEFVSCGHDGRILLWDLTMPGAEPQVLREADSTPRAIRALAAIPGANAVLTTMHDGRILRWWLDRPGDSELVGAHFAGALAVAPDGSYAVSVGEDKNLLRWDLQRPGEPVGMGMVGARARAVAIVPDGTRAITGDDKGRVLSWDMEMTGFQFSSHLVGRHTPDVYEQPKRIKIRSVAVAADGSWLASAADDGMIECWNPAGGGAASLLPVALPRAMAAVGGRLLAGDRRGGLSLFDVIGTETAPRPKLRAPEMTLVVDQYWCNKVRGSQRMDLGAMRADLSGGRIAEAFLPLPDLSHVSGFRIYLLRTGWTVPVVSPGYGPGRDMVTELAAGAAASGDVTVVTGNLEIRSALSAVPGQDRITFVDDIERWVEPEA
jgi:WD40 repeat protein